MALLYHKGADPKATHEGKGVVELAIESRDAQAMQIAFRLCEDPEGCSSKGSDMATLPCAMGLTQDIHHARAQELIRRQAHRLDDALEQGGRTRDRQRL